MLEVRLDEKLNKYIVAALSTDKNADFVIVCKDEYEAKSICTQITMGMIPSPVDNPLKYQSCGVHPDGKTKIYNLK